MAFYRSLLEEQYPETMYGYDNSISEYSQSLINEIDNADETITESKCIDSPNDVMDEMYFAIAESEMYWNNVMQQIGISELHESHYGVVNESLDSIKDWFKRAKDRIAEFFKKVWQVIKRWASNIFATLHTNKSFADKYGSQMDKGYQIYCKGEEKLLKGYPYTGLRNRGIEKPFDDISEASKKLETDIDTLVSAFKGTISVNASYIMMEVNPLAKFGTALVSGITTGASMLRHATDSLMGSKPSGGKGSPKPSGGKTGTGGGTGGASPKPSTGNNGGGSGGSTTPSNPSTGTGGNGSTSGGTSNSTGGGGSGSSKPSGNGSGGSTTPSKPSTGGGSGGASISASSPTPPTPDELEAIIRNDIMAVFSKMGARGTDDNISATECKDIFESNLRFGDDNHVNEEPYELEKNEAPTVDTIKTYLKNGDKLKKATKKAMDDSKKSFKASIRSLDNLEKRINTLLGKEKKSINDNILNEMLRACSTVNKGLNDGLTLIQVIRSCAMANIRKFIGQCRHFGNYYVRLANKANPKMKGFKDESAYIGGIDLL